MGRIGVKGEGNKRLTVITPTKGEAEKIGRDIARHQKTELAGSRPARKNSRQGGYGNDLVRRRIKALTIF